MEAFRHFLGVILLVSGISGLLGLVYTQWFLKVD